MPYNILNRERESIITKKLDLFDAANTCQFKLESNNLEPKCKTSYSLLISAARQDDPKLLRVLLGINIP